MGRGAEGRIEPCREAGAPDQGRSGGRSEDELDALGLNSRFTPESEDEDEDGGDLVVASAAPCISSLKKFHSRGFGPES